MVKATRFVPCPELQRILTLRHRCADVSYSNRTGKDHCERVIDVWLGGSRNVLQIYVYQANDLLDQGNLRLQSKEALASSDLESFIL